MANSRTARKKMSRTKKILFIVLSIFTVLIASGGVYAYSLYKKLDNTYKPLNRDKSDKRDDKVSLGKGDQISVLLLGVDQMQGQKGRSDTMIVLTIDPKSKTSKMVSIPRDSYVMIEGKGFNDKITHAFAFGGAEMSVNTVENFLNIPIDYYAEVNMKGLVDIVDLIGGVTVYNDFAFTNDDSSHSKYSNESHTYPKGNVHLTGDNILPFVRMRYEDPRGDFGRQERQRVVIEAIAKKSMSFASITKINGFMDALGKNVETNVAVGDMVKMINTYAPAMNGTETLSLRGTGGIRQGDNGRAWYYDVDEQSRKEVSQELRGHLGL